MIYIFVQRNKKTFFTFKKILSFIKKKLNSKLFSVQKQQRLFIKKL